MRSIRHIVALSTLAYGHVMSRDNFRNVQVVVRPDTVSDVMRLSVSLYLLFQAPIPTLSSLNYLFTRHTWLPLVLVGI